MQGRVIWMCRARGFKDFDEYETVKGFEVHRRRRHLLFLRLSFIGLA